MTIHEIAREILTAATIHVHASLDTGKYPEDGPERRAAFSQMKIAEEKLVTALEGYKQQIISNLSTPK